MPAHVDAKLLAIVTVDEYADQRHGYVRSTHLQMYETVSDGTPISPVFASPHELATYLATTDDPRASAFAHRRGSYDEWLRLIQTGLGMAGFRIERADQEHIRLI
jgi:hypothetical protein